MQTTTVTPAKLLKQPLTEFFDRLSAPVNLSKTLNRLLFNALMQQQPLQADELENMHALLDFLLACQVAQRTTIVLTEQ